MSSQRMLWPVPPQEPPPPGLPVVGQGAFTGHRARGRGMTAIITGIVLFLVAVCGTAIGCGVVRFTRAVLDYRARANFSRVFTAKAGSQ